MKSTFSGLGLAIVATVVLAMIAPHVAVIYFFGSLWYLGRSMR